MTLFGRPRIADGRIGGGLLLFSEVINEPGKVRFRRPRCAVPGQLRERGGSVSRRFLRAADAVGPTMPCAAFSADELVTGSFQHVTHPHDLASDRAEVKLMHEGKCDGC
jgi:hypothetical protein